MKCEPVFNKFRDVFKGVDPNKRTFTPVLQYKIRNSSGAIEKCMVADLKKLEIFEGETAAAEVTIEIDDDDMLAVGTLKTTYAELMAAGKVKTSGNTDLLIQLDQKYKERAGK